MGSEFCFYEVTKMLKLVDYNLYCSKCKHKDNKESEDPCYECLTIPVNEDSHKPRQFEETDCSKKY